MPLGGCRVHSVLEHSHAFLYLLLDRCITATGMTCVIQLAEMAGSMNAKGGRANAGTDRRLGSG